MTTLLARRLMASGGVGGLRYVGSRQTFTNYTLSGFSQNLTLSLNVNGGLGGPAQEGDLCILVAGGADPSDENISVTSAGWTELLDIYSGDTVNPGANLAVAWKIMGSTPDTSVTVDTNCNGGLVGIVHVWRGADPVTPFDVTSTTATGTGAPNAPSITPVTPGAIIIAVGAVNGGVSQSRLIAPTGMSREDGSFASSTGYEDRAFAAEMAAIRWSGSGAYDPAVFTGGNSAQFDDFCAATLAIRPA